jgi:mannose-6-phosphate isomerase-like protein (cupin superfamily)
MDLLARLAERDLAPPGSGVVLVEWGDDGGGFEPPRWIAPLHRHFGDEEAWYVLEGTLGFLVDGEQLRASAGEAVIVPRGAAHTYWNAGRGPARYLLVMSPSIKAIIDELHGPGGKDDATLAAIFARHDGEFLGWEPDGSRRVTKPSPSHSHVTDGEDQARG